MKYYLVISLLIATAVVSQAQVIVNHDLADNITPKSTTVLSEGARTPEYSVSYVAGQGGSTFEVVSPKAERAEVRLVTLGGSEVCMIHNGLVKEGKNVFTLRHRKFHKGAYYVVSKLSSGEEFADKIIVPE